MNTDTVNQTPAPALNEAQTNQMNAFIQNNVDIGVVSRKLTEYIIERAGGWQKFIDTSYDLSFTSIESGFKGFAGMNDITQIFYAQKDELVSFANVLSWDYDCDNAHDLALKFLEGKGYTYENMESVFDSNESDAPHEHVECFFDVAQWIVWNGAQYVFDSYALYLKDMDRSTAAVA